MVWNLYAKWCNCSIQDLNFDVNLILCIVIAIGNQGIVLRPVASNANSGMQNVLTGLLPKDKYWEMLVVILFSVVAHKWLRLRIPNFYTL